MHNYDEHINDSVSQSFELFLVGPNSINDSNSQNEDESIEIANEIKDHHEEEQIEEKHIVPPNSPAEPILNVSRNSSNASPQNESEPLYPTPAEPAMPPSENNSSNEDISLNANLQDSSLIHTEVSDHTVPSTAVRTL